MGHPSPEQLGPPSLRLAGFQLWVHGWQFPEAQDRWDGNWLNVTADCGEAGASVWATGAILDTIGLLRFRAIAAMRHGLRLNPFWMDHNAAFGYLLVRLGEYDAAIEQFRKTLELDSNYVSAWLWLGEAHAYKGDQGAALEARLETLPRVLLPSRVAEVGTRLERVYARSGWSGFWRSELALAEEDLRRPGTVWKESWARLSSPFGMARRYARLGQWDQALAALEQAYEERYFMMPFVQREPLFEPLRQHRRYQDLILRMGLPPA